MHQELDELKAMVARVMGVMFAKECEARVDGDSNLAWKYGDARNELLEAYYRIKKAEEKV